MEDYDDIVVSDTDELTVDGGSAADRTRTIKEYKSTDLPLSAAEIERRKRLHRRAGNNRAEGWVPRTIANVEDLTPILER